MLRIIFKSEFSYLATISVAVFCYEKVMKAVPILWQVTFCYLYKLIKESSLLISYRIYWILESMWIPFCLPPRSWSRSIKILLSLIVSFCLFLYALDSSLTLNAKLTRTGLALKTSFDHYIISYSLIFSGKFCTIMVYWSGETNFFYRDAFSPLILYLTYIEHAKIAKAVMTLIISVLWAVTSPDDSRLIIGIPKKYTHYFVQLSVTRK